MKKIYALKEKDQFIKEAESILFEALDEEREVPIVISVSDVSVELPMSADCWNEIDFALKECYEVEYCNLSQTTGNTKSTSADLIRKYLVNEIRRESDNDGDYMKVYQRFVRMCSYPTTLSDVAECIRIENDLRDSEVKVLYDDFEDDKLDEIVEKEIKDYLMSKFEIDYSEEGGRSFLMFFGRWDHGQVIDFSWGYEDNWEADKKETVDNLWEEIVKNSKEEN